MLTEKMQSPIAGRKASAQIAEPVALASGPVHYRQDDIVLLFVELEHHLHAPELVPRAKVDGCRGTEEIHTVRAVAGPGIKILEIEAGLFLLKKYSHTLHVAPHQSLLPPPTFLRRRPVATLSLAPGYQASLAERLIYAMGK
jgi:hypothetical protein